MRRFIKHEMKYFERLGRKATPASPKAWKAKVQPFYNTSNNLASLRRKLARVFVWHRPGSSQKTPSPEVTCTSTPETTSLIDLDDLSLYRDDSYLYKSASSESNEVGARRFETFPYWDDARAMGVDEPSMAVSESSEVKRAEERSTLLRRSLRAVLQKTRSRSTTSSYSPSYSPTHHDTDDDEHFSISTEAQQQQCPCVTISVTVGDDELTPGYAPSSDRSFSSKSSTRSQPMSLATRESHVSLDQFMEEKQREAESIMTGPIALGDIDGASVGSACLDVAFDGDYPQLVLTPSRDGTASRMTGCSSTVQSNGTLGASYPHPAAPKGGSSRSVSSFDTARKNTSCTPRWLNDSIDRVWNQIDRSQSNVDANTSNYSGSCYQSDTTMNDTLNDTLNDTINEEEQQRLDEFIYRYSKEGGVSGESAEVKSLESGIDDLDEDSLDDVPPPPPSPETPDRTKSDFECDTDGFTWVQDMWSFSAEESALSISNRIEQGVIHPILKPICHLVEATEIPDAVMCTSSKYKRPPLSRKSKSNTSYCMAPRIVSHG